MTGGNTNHYTTADLGICSELLGYRHRFWSSVQSFVSAATCPQGTYTKPSCVDRRLRGVRAAAMLQQCDRQIVPIVLYRYEWYGFISTPIPGIHDGVMCVYTPPGQFARVVKGVDLRSAAGNCAWARTPQLTFVPVMLLIHSVLHSEQ